MGPCSCAHPKIVGIGLGSPLGFGFDLNTYFHTFFNAKWIFFDANFSRNTIPTKRKLNADLPFSFSLKHIASSVLSFSFATFKRKGKIEKTHHLSHQNSIIMQKSACIWCLYDICLCAACVFLYMLSKKIILFLSILAGYWGWSQCFSCGFCCFWS